jgi:RimJ/RimL family protein N-acetyltransferase
MTFCLFIVFITDLFNKNGFNKINFCVAIGNPAEKMYDKIVRKYGGKIVGIFKNDVRLWDGKIYDTKHYEILKEEFKLKENK